MKKKIDKLITVIDRTFFFQKFVCAFFNGIESFCFLWKEVELRQQKYGENEKLCKITDRVEQILFVWE